MRAMIFVAVLTSAALTGCDQTPAPVAAPAAPPPQAAVLPPPPAPQLAQAAPVRHHRRHRERYASGYAESSAYSESREYSQNDVSTYGYVSDSRSSYAGNANYEGASAPRAGGGLWVDGYGRGYFTAGHAVRAGTMRGKRLSPWHGYDVDCDR
ncbi:MAG TPA: hypothetical protein VN932_00785 [Rhizomicrobium sp.]|nr:hypothetical protein [Rhizomicrobium sp.]